MNNNIKQFDKDAYERLENALKESSHLIQINADSGLTYDVNSENVPERFYIRDGEFNKVETVPFKLFGQEIQVPIRTVKQKLPNGFKPTINKTVGTTKMIGQSALRAVVNQLQ